MVRYQTKLDRAEENQELIEAVFAELELRQPEGFTYKVFRLEDRVSFLHVASSTASTTRTPCRTCQASKPSWPISPTGATSSQCRWEQPSSAAIADFRPLTDGHCRPVLQRALDRRRDFAEAL